jgi:hypothetical protein
MQLGTEAKMRNLPQVEIIADSRVTAASCIQDCFHCVVQDS